MTYLVYDIVIGLILLVFALRGRKRGLVLTLCSIAAIITAFIGANLIADVLTPKAADIMVPKITSVIERRLQIDLDESIEAAQQSDPSSGDASGSISSGDNASPDTASEETDSNVLSVVLEKLNLPSELFDSIREALSSLESVRNLPAVLSQAIARTAAEAILYLLIFLLSFLVLLLVWRVIGSALDLVARLPVLHFFNKTGGFVLGFCKGMLFFFILAWIVRYLGGIVPDEAIDHTYLLHFFMTTSPFTLFAGL